MGTRRMPTSHQFRCNSSLAPLSVFTAAPVCRPNPCQNSGTCSRHRRRSKFSCTCPNQFKGRFCEIGMVPYHHFIRSSGTRVRALESFPVWVLLPEWGSSQDSQTTIASALQPNRITPVSQTGLNAEHSSCLLSETLG